MLTRQADGCNEPCGSGGREQEGPKLRRRESCRRERERGREIERFLREKVCDSYRLLHGGPCWGNG